MLDERPRWLGTVASRVAAQYQDPPAGRLRELTRFLAGVPALRDACARGDATRVRRWLHPRVEMRATRWDVPPLAAPGAVASWLGLSPTELEWFADARGLERPASAPTARPSTRSRTGGRSDRGRLPQMWRRGRAPNSWPVAVTPQGAPTSPPLANLVAFGLDVRLSAAAASAGATYTRYADDLVFSGSHAFARRASGFESLVGAVAIEEGFALNHRKTRVMKAGGRQRVAGLVVNERPRVSRAEADRVKAIVHNCVRLGPTSQNREWRADFRSYVRGLIAWVGVSDSERARRLLEGFARIRWE